MNSLKNLLLLALIVSLGVFISCGDDDDDDDDDVMMDTPADVFTQNLTSGAFSVAGGGSVVQPDGVDADWSAFTLSFTGNATDGGTYTASGQPADADNAFQLVWPNSGTWSFVTPPTVETTGSITRDDGVQIAVNVTESQVILTFTLQSNTGRVNDVGGEWVFTLTR
ncbi:MAG TPA: hypothetical protein ACFCUD_08020 [Cyclobacteriaceae bacterium]